MKVNHESVILKKKDATILSITLSTRLSIYLPPCTKHNTLLNGRTCLRVRGRAGAGPRQDHGAGPGRALFPVPSDPRSPRSVGRSLRRRDPHWHGFHFQSRLVFWFFSLFVFEDLVVLCCVWCRKRRKRMLVFDFVYSSVCLSKWFSYFFVCFIIHLFIY